MSAPVAPFDRPRNRGNSLVFKSGPLYISSKGLGWKSWKRRWFMLTRTSLVFFKNDPNVLPQRGNELNLTLGGIDLNNSGSVLVRADKKLLTVLFPDGRAFTLKAETIEDLEEWKAALERALVAAPNAALVMGQNGIFRNDSIDALEGPAEPGRDRRPVKSLVIGRPILLALEDIDGSPSFLEKALCFIERHGVKVEGILRQSADVDDVDQRVREYEQGKNQFSPDEDAHVIGDCIKLVLRELPSSPVPTPCCTALLEAHRIEGREARIAAMCTAIAETFPEPNRRLLQRVLKMMLAVSAHTAENRMTASAVAACMSPLLLRPLLAGECGLEDESDISGDNATQLLAAATAANNAQAIITTLLEEYNNIFEDVGPLQALPSPDMYTRVEDSESEGSSDGAVSQIQDNTYHDAQNDPDAGLDDRLLSGTFSESSGNAASDPYDFKVFEGVDSEVDSLKAFGSGITDQRRSTKRWSYSVNIGSKERAGPGRLLESDSLNETSIGICHSSWGEVESPVTSPRLNVSSSSPGICSSKTTLKPQSSASSSKRPSIWGFSSANKKNVPTDATDSSGEEELAIQRLEATRNELRNKIAKEAKGNAVLQASLERRKQALHERRLALEQDVIRLQEQLQAERDLRAALDIGISMSTSQFGMAHGLDSKTRVELEEIAVAEADVARLKQKVSELHAQLDHHRQQHGASLTETNEHYQRVRSLQAQQKILQQELDLTLALCQHEQQKNIELEGKSGHDHASTLEQVILQQRNALAEAKEALKAERIRGLGLRHRAVQDVTAGSDWRTLRPPAGPSAASRQFAWRQRSDSSSNPDSRQTDAIVNYASDGACDMENHNNGKRIFMDVDVSNAGAYQHQSLSSYALAELTARLDFFKERRSQLMEQLHNLDLTFAPSPLNDHDPMYSSAQPWTCPH
eukprot:c29169_g2_i2 orf=419-3184(-)